jgi:hypothetical protein
LHEGVFLPLAACHLPPLLFEVRGTAHDERDPALFGDPRIGLDAMQRARGYGVGRLALDALPELR